MDFKFKIPFTEKSNIITISNHIEIISNIVNEFSFEISEMRKSADEIIVDESNLDEAAILVTKADALLKRIEKARKNGLEQLNAEIKLVNTACKKDFNTPLSEIISIVNKKRIPVIESRRNAAEKAAIELKNSGIDDVAIIQKYKDINEYGTSELVEIKNFRIEDPRKLPLDAFLNFDLVGYKEDGTANSNTLLTFVRNVLKTGVRNIPGVTLFKTKVFKNRAKRR